MLEGEFALGSVTRVSLPQNCVAVTGDNLATLESGPNVFLDSVVCGLFTNLGLQLAKPDKDFLIGKSMKRTGETVKSSAVGKERIREGRSN